MVLFIFLIYFEKMLLNLQGFSSSGAKVTFGCEDPGLGHLFLQKSIFPSLFHASYTKNRKIISQKSAFYLNFSPCCTTAPFPPEMKPNPQTEPELSPRALGSEAAVTDASSLNPGAEPGLRKSPGSAEVTIGAALGGSG